MDEQWEVTEERRLVERWGKTGLLKGLPEELKGSVVIAMENQRLYNEKADNNSNSSSQFARVSISMIRRIFNIKIPNVTLRSKIAIKDCDCQMYTFPERMFWNPTVYTVFTNSRRQHRLDFEANNVIDLSEKTIPDRIAHIVNNYNFNRGFTDPNKLERIFYLLGLGLNDEKNLVMFYKC